MSPAFRSVATTGAPTVAPPVASSGTSRRPFSVDGNVGGELTGGASATRGDTPRAVLFAPCPSVYEAVARMYLRSKASVGV